MEIAIIQSKIYEVRGTKVMLDKDLAELYQVTTGNLNKAVKRNIKRFPPDFMFQLTTEEWKALRFQNGIIKKGRGEHTKYLPYAFTEQGLAMLSGVLNSDIAINVNISIMRAFVAIRQGLPQVSNNKELEELKARMKELEEVSEETMAAISDLSEDTRKELDDIYLALSQLAAKQKKISKPQNPIGYKAIQERRTENEE
ncbi:ORF6N domain-containing protein [Phocaeicola faecium]|uniref:ORF6N domain-containing protein n=1 Tax=Phocaeicola faecium TaxID=2762213 RepID=A0ABR8VEB9_9BACT|nr:ORF6N domain-containing protein [Phocaeicola faecium]MBD8003128.1 ORF6N domain-containing protein [Phocaeicola faecium]